MVYQLSDLSISFGSQRVVEGLSFSVSAGECVALVGESGSGKSQACLAPFGLTTGVAAGSAQLGGVELIGRDERALRQIRGAHAGFVFQQPLSALTPHLTIGRQLAEAMGGSDQSRLEDALVQVGLDRPAVRLRQFPHQLSGGQRQRVMIAMAVAHKPKLLIADEPTTALDAMLRRDILDLLDELRASHGLAVILVSHDLGLVARHADQLVVMRKGRPVEQGAAKTLLTHATTDYTRALIAAAPQMDTPLPQLKAVGEPILVAQDLSVCFRQPGFLRRYRTAVNKAGLVIHQGEALALIGGSGSGKSTLARAVAGLAMQDGRTQQAGAIAWREQPLSVAVPFSGDVRRAIQVVAQDPVDSLDPRWTAGQSIAEGQSPLQLAAVQKAKIIAALAEVELGADMAERRPSQISGGQAQRVALARALAANPALLICDEATSALDVTVQAEVIALLKRLQQERGLAMLFISHDLALVRQFCHSVAVMDDGQIVEQGLIADVLDNPQSDVTRRLIAASS